MTTKSQNQKRSGAKWKSNRLPERLPLTSVRRAVFESMVMGYFMCQMNALLSVAKNSNFAARLADALLKEEDLFAEYLETHKRLSDDPSTENTIEVIIKLMHEVGLNRPGPAPLPETLLTSVAKRQRRRRGKKEA